MKWQEDLEWGGASGGGSSSKILLYKEGTQYVQFDSGWSYGGFTQQGYSINADNISVRTSSSGSGVSCTFGTTSKVDLSNASHVYARVKGISGLSLSDFWFAISNQKSVYTNYAVRTNFNNPSTSSDVTIALDCSNLNSQYYIGLCTASYSNSGFYVYELWCE